MFSPQVIVVRTITAAADFKNAKQRKMKLCPLMLIMVSLQVDMGGVKMLEENQLYCSIPGGCFVGCIVDTRKVSIRYFCGLCVALTFFGGSHKTLQHSLCFISFQCYGSGE